MSLTRVVRLGVPVVALAAVLVTAAPASAQVAVSGGLDFTNQYNFRGIRQNSEGVSIWPFIDFGGTVFEGDGAVKSVGVNAGTWNAFHSQINETDFGTGNKWYESDIYGVVALNFSQAALGFTYTAYTSPADLFTTVHELAVKVTATSVGANVGLNPYGLVAFELGDGQADAGAEKGTYLELGVAPSVAGDRATIAFPVKLGFSLKDYYEFGTGEDSKFGYFSVAGIVTVPLGANANIHGGVELQTFGENLKNYNSFGDDPFDPRNAAVIGSIGLGFSF
jgi:hypothetical protein